MNVPFLDVGAQYRELSVAIDEAIARVCHSGWFVLGHEVREFEAEWARYCEATHCIGVGNGLDALTLTLRALEIGPGDEVIVPGNTFVATWNAVALVGATPVGVDPDEDTHLIDASAVEGALTPRTRAIIPVHLYGRLTDVEAIAEMVRGRGIAIIEDAAQAHGARMRGKSAGHSSAAACWSFYPGKNLGAMGDAGAVTTHDEALAERIRLLANYGSRQKYHHDSVGVNSRLDEVQAAVLRVKLPHLSRWTERRRGIARRYDKELRDSALVIPGLPCDGAEHVWHLYVVRCASRDRLHEQLRLAGVQTLIHYPIASSDQPPYRDTVGDRCPVSRQLAREVLSLPMGPHMSERDVDEVIAAVQSIAGGC